MKKCNLLLVSLLALSPLAGCTDAQAKLKDAKTVLFSIGGDKITKGELFDLMKSTAGTSAVIADATTKITDAEVDTTPEMEEQAKTALEAYKSMYGDTFNLFLEQNNMTEEDYLEKKILPSLRAEQLPRIYIEDNWKDITTLYQPVKATILEFTSQDDANAALSELKDGSKTPAEAAAGHNSSSNGQSTLITMQDADLDSAVRTVLTNGKTDDGWSLIPTTDGSKIFVVHLDDNDPNNFKEETINKLASFDKIKSDASTYFFFKYGFHVYDITIYNALKADYPDYLVQDLDSTFKEDSDKKDSSKEASSTNE